MHKCLNCGQEFEGKFCPECGTEWKEKKNCPKCGTFLTGGAKFCNNCGYSFVSANGAQTQKSTGTFLNGLSIGNILTYFPAVLAVLFSVLLFGLYAAPAITANLLGAKGSDSVYQAISDGNVQPLHASMYSLIAFACISAVAALIYCFAVFKKKNAFIPQLLSFACYLGIIITASAAIGIIKKEDNGYGVFSAGGGLIAVLVIACVFFVLSAGCVLAKRYFISSKNKQINFSISGNVLRWVKAHKKIIIPVGLVTVFAVVMCSLIPTFILASVNGTYYLSRAGELNEDKYITLSTGKFTDSDGANGTYKVNGKEVVFYAVDPILNTPMQLHATVDNKVITIKGEFGATQIYCKQNHKHKFGEWEVFREPTCTQEGQQNCSCDCGKLETQEIAAKGHDYTVWTTTKKATCTEDGEQERSCNNCKITEIKTIYSEGHRFSEWTVTKKVTCTSDGSKRRTCSVCRTSETETIISVGHLFDENQVCTTCKLAYDNTNQLIYKLNSSGNYTVDTQSSFDRTEIIIPQSYYGITVTSIGYDAFNGCSSLTSITIPDSVTSIGKGAFNGCSSLTSATIPALAISLIPKSHLKTVIITSGDSIGSYAFSGCSSLTSITIPNSVTSIGQYAFCGCSSLESITIPNSITSIGGSVFEDCSSLISVTIPAFTIYLIPKRNLKTVIITSGDSIDNYAFRNCSSLTSVTIANSVSSIGKGTFWSCSSLESITVANGNTKYHSAGNCIIETESKTLIAGCKTSIIPDDDSVTSIGQDAFYDCSSLTSITIPDSVTSIEEYAFYDCSSLTSITIPDSVTSIGQDAFYGCYSLTIYCEATNKPYGWDSNWNGSCPVVWDCKNNDKNENGYIYAVIDGIRYSLKNNNATVKSQPQTIGGEIIVPETVTYNEQSYNVTSIDRGAFNGCTSLTSITIPNGVTSIGEYAFLNCSSLTSITIPNSVTYIGQYAFCGCSSSLESITVESGNTKYRSASNCLIDTESNTLILGCKNSIIPEDGSITSIGDYAFSDCYSLTSITIPNSVTSIGYYAFDGCYSLTSITIPDGVTSIGYYAFYDCSSLTRIDFNGTMAEWKAIKKGRDWNENTGNYTVYCTDGEIKKADDK